ncbi:MAG TPA: type II toxin-antitoxin system VapC family toxin [Gemmatimonadaceae bacterium]
MRFWDASALVPLVLEQPLSERSRQLHAADPEIVAWWGSSIECASAIARLRREGRLTAAEESQARSLLGLLSASWFEVQPGSLVRAQALRLLRLHPLRSADALQLAAAIEWAGSPPEAEFVSFDERLNSAAEREGFVRM